MEAFEKELHIAKVKDVDEEEGPDAQPEEIDETELGEDPFAGGDGAVSLDAGNEPWLKSDRDYTYPEVYLKSQITSTFSPITYCSFFYDSMPSFMLPTPHFLHQQENDTLLHLHSLLEKVTRRPSLSMSPISAKGCIVPPNMSFSTCLQKWVPQVPWMALAVSLSEVASSKNRLNTFSVGTLVGVHLFPSTEPTLRNIAHFVR